MKENFCHLLTNGACQKVMHKWHSIKEKPVENSGVYCSFGMGMKPISPAIFKNEKFYSVVNGNEIEYVAWWRYSI